MGRGTWPSLRAKRKRPLEVYHGKVGRGLSVEMSVKNGPVTLLSVVQTVDGKLKLLTAQGHSVPGPILEIGNTNSRYCFAVGARNFMNEWNLHGPAHHWAVGVGHIASNQETRRAVGHQLRPGLLTLARYASGGGEPRRSRSQSSRMI
jgi:L-arabinose isomerase